MTSTRSSVVDAVVVGAQKAGTTSLHAALARHPAAATTPVKETKAFVRDEVWADHRRVLETAFASARDRLRVEVDPDCLEFEAAAGRIASHNPDARIVISLRDPVARLLSHVRMNRARAVETLPLADALAAEQVRVARGTTERIHFSYVSRSCYAAPVGRYLATFGADQVLVLRFEDLVEDWAVGWRRLTDHLELPPAPDVATMPREHAAAGLRSDRLSSWFYAPEGPVRRGVKSALKRVPGAFTVADRIKEWNHRGPVPEPDAAADLPDVVYARLREDAAALAPLVDFDPLAWKGLAGGRS